MAKIAYKIGEDATEVSVDGVHVATKFDAELILTELTTENRVTIGLPVEKSNPDFDSYEPIDEDNMPTVPMTQPEIETATINLSRSLPPHIKEATAIKDAIMEIVDRKTKQYSDLLNEEKTTKNTKLTVSVANRM